MRWSSEILMRLTSTPSKANADALDTIEAEENPQEHSATEEIQHEPGHARARRRLNIDFRDKCSIRIPQRMSQTCSLSTRQQRRSTS